MIDAEHSSSITAMKIIHVLNHYLPKHIAGTEIYVHRLAKALQQRSFDVVVLIPNYDAEERATYTIDNIRVIQYAEPTKIDRSLRLGLRPPDGLRHFLDVLQAERPDIIHFHELAGSSGVGIWHIRAARQTGARLFMTMHLARYTCHTGTLLYKGQVPCNGVIDLKRCTECAFEAKGMQGIKAQWLSASARMLHQCHVNPLTWNSPIGTALGFPFLIDRLRQHLSELAATMERIVTVADWYQQVLLRNGIAESKLKHIRHGLPPFAGSEGLPVRQPAKPIKGVFVGRISHLKGLSQLIEAMRDISPEALSIDIWGDSGEQGFLETCKQQSQGMTNLNWMGRLAPEQVVDTVKQYDFLCLPSAVREMSPLVIQEAFAAGIPVLASDGGGNSEMVQHDRNGWLFKFRDAKDLGVKLARLVEDPALLIRARNYIPPVRTIDEMTEEYIALYSSVGSMS